MGPIEQQKKVQVQQPIKQQPVQTNQVGMQNEPLEKKPKWWLWVIIALLGLVVVATAVYFIFVR